MGMLKVLNKKGNDSISNNTVDGVVKASFRVKIHVLKEDEGGAGEGLFTKKKYDFKIANLKSFGEIGFTNSYFEMPLAGDDVEIEVKLFKDLEVKTGDKVTVLSNSLNVASGTVTKVYKK